MPGVDADSSKETFLDSLLDLSLDVGLETQI